MNNRDTEILLKDLLKLADTGPQMYTGLLLAAIAKIKSLDNKVVLH